LVHQTLFDALLAAIEYSGWNKRIGAGEILLLRAALIPDDAGAQQRLASVVGSLASTPVNWNGRCVQRFQYLGESQIQGDQSSSAHSRHVESGC